MQLIKAEYVYLYGCAAPLLSVASMLFYPSLCLLSVVLMVLWFRCTLIDYDGAW